MVDEEEPMMVAAATIIETNEAEMRNQSGMKRPPSNAGINQYRKETTHKIVKRGSPANMPMGGGDPYEMMNIQTIGKSKNFGGMMNKTMQES